jgi:hypothetical protein
MKAIICPGLTNNFQHEDNNGMYFPESDKKANGR